MPRLIKVPDVALTNSPATRGRSHGAASCWGVPSIILAVALLSGCASSPQIVQVPIPLPPPKAPAIERPTLPIEAVTEAQIVECETKDVGCGEILRAWALSYEALRAWGLEQEALLNGYR